MPQHGADDVTSNLSYSCLSCLRPSTHPAPTPNFWLFPLSFSSLMWCHLPRIFAQGTNATYGIYTTAPSRSCLRRPHFGLFPVGWHPIIRNSQVGINIHIYMKYEWESPALHPLPRISIFPRMDQPLLFSHCPFVSQDEAHGTTIGHVCRL